MIRTLQISLYTLICTALITTTLSSHAEDHILILGGGYSPSGNQISLERNVIYFRKMLQDKRMDNLPQSIYFADGNNPGRDLQYIDPNAQIPRLNILMARVLNQTRGISHQYRNTELGKTDGESSRANISKWFDTTGKQLKKGDRLIIYFTGHGGSKNKDENTKLYLWNGQTLYANDFVKELDKVSNDVPVMVVMVQCYSGGFANIIFNEADSKKGMSNANRFGFYSTVFSRVAAGCTPEINERNYQEYSSHFWAALYGQTRVGESVTQPDYDNDGQTSFAEAHAYVLLNAKNIDIPIKTTDRYLRVYSKIKDKKNPSLLGADMPYDELLRRADPTEKAVLEGLSEQFGLTGNDRVKQAIAKAKHFQEEQGKASKEKKDISGKYHAARKKIETALVLRWPEIKSPWHPRNQQTLTEERDAVIALIEKHPDYRLFTELGVRMGQASQQELDMNKSYAQIQRFVHLAENIAYAGNLPRVAKPEEVKRYEQLKALEAGNLQPSGKVASK